MKFIHLSHTDLDGYGCQLVTKEYFKDGLFYNANYGLEVKQNIAKIVSFIENNLDQDIFLLITDLNLTLKESRDLDNIITKLNNDGSSIKLQLLDHHLSGEISSQKFEWYYLDTTRCATKIVYEYIVNEYNGFDDFTIKWLEPLVDVINAVDIWLDDDIENFEFGKVCLGLIGKAKEINQLLFPDLNRDYKLFLLKQSTKYINKDKSNILLDNDIHTIKKSFLKLNQIDDTIDNLSAKRLVNSLEYEKNNLTIYYKSYKGLLTFTLGSISIPANEFLRLHVDYDFFMDVGRKGHVSLRANGNLDVSILSSKLCNGGGHKNASGGKFEIFKDNSDYVSVKNFVQNKLNNII